MCARHGSICEGFDAYKWWICCPRYVCFWGLIVGVFFGTVSLSGLAASHKGSKSPHCLAWSPVPMCQSFGFAGGLWTVSTESLSGALDTFLLGLNLCLALLLSCK